MSRPTHVAYNRRACTSHGHTWYRSTARQRDVAFNPEPTSPGPTSLAVHALPLLRQRGIIPAHYPQRHEVWT